jgi:hypothetical protein
MRKFLFLLSLVFVFTIPTVAQTVKKKAATKTATQPTASLASPANLSGKEPSFIGFVGTFIKFGKISGGNRSFIMSIEHSPWFFEVKGTANADHSTGDLHELLGDIVAVLAYYDAQGKSEDGTKYQAGLFDFMLYLDDEPIKISNVSFTMIGKATAGSATLAQAKTWNFESGKVFKTQKYSNSIIKAQAGAIDKGDLEKEEVAAKKRTADSIEKEKKRVSDSIAKVEKRKRDSIAREEERIQDSTAEFEALKEQAKRKAAAQKKKKKAIVIEDDDEDEDDYEPPPPPKKKKKK